MLRSSAIAIIDINDRMIRTFQTACGDKRLWRANQRTSILCTSRLHSSLASTPIEVDKEHDMQKRAVICHYHIYKNSGTSFSRLLEANFGARHVNFDGPIAGFQINQDQLAEIVENNPEVVSISSHQIYLPAPSTLNIRFIPVVFLRHPLLRIRSIFLFETSGNSGASTAVAMTDRLQPFQAWATDRLSNSSHLLSISNAQTNQLARAYCRAPQMRIADGACIHDMDLALNNLSLVTCLARTEAYAGDVSLFESTLANNGIEFTSQLGRAENISSGDFDAPLSRQLETFRASMTQELWDRLVDINQQDQALYDFAGELIQRRAADQ